MNRPTTWLVLIGLASWVCAAELRADIVALQQGLNGYTGTTDVYLDNLNPTTPFTTFNDAAQTGGRDVVEVWGSSLATSSPAYDTTRPGPGYFQALLKFDDLFATLPAEAQPVAAELTFYVRNNFENLGMHRMLTPWEEANATWNHFGTGAISAGGGITLGVDTLLAADYTGAVNTGLQTIDVTDTVLAWFQDPSTNHGWALLHADRNRGQFVTSEDALLADRPMLSITYRLPEPSTWGLLLAGGTLALLGRWNDRSRGPFRKRARLVRS